VMHSYNGKLEPSFDHAIIYLSNADCGKPKKSYTSDKCLQDDLLVILLWLSELPFLSYAPEVSTAPYTLPQPMAQHAIFDY